MVDEGPAKIKSFHDEGLRFINEGLKFDEQGNHRQALQLYHKGIRSLITGCSVYCRGTGPKYDTARQMQEKMKLAKEQVEERVAALSSQVNATSCAANAAKPAVNGVVSESLTTSSQGGPWEDVNELLVLENGVKMFFVSEQGHVTTIAQPQTLRAYQFIKYEEGCPYPPAFLQCSGWMFPMVPKRSPVLNTEPHTYMFPDINIDMTRPASSTQRQGKFASVGLIINPHITPLELNRFERILRCYTDYHHYTPTPQEYKELQAVNESSRVEPTGPHIGEGRSHYTEPAPLEPSTTVAVRPSPGDVAGKAPHRAEDQEEITWGEKVSKGIMVGAELIAWGLVKGAQVGSHLVYQGGVKIRENLKPNETPTEVDEKVQDNIRHVKSVAGVACQVSATVVSAVAALTAELGKRLAPVIIDHGGKMLPESVKKKTNDEDGEKMMKEAVKVAVSGAQGFASVYQSLEMSWRMLYKSLQLTTVETVDHKYGTAVGEATNNSMGALGYALQTAWNVDNLGVKALAKRTAKDAGKEVIKEAEKKYISTDNQIALQ